MTSVADPDETGAEVERLRSELAKAEESLRRLSKLLFQVQDEERRRMSRELHDTTVQTLSALMLNLAAVKQFAKFDEQPKAFKALSESLSLADQASRELRTFSYLLYPPLLDEAGLAQAVRWYVEEFTRRTGIQVELKMSPEPLRLSRDVETALFRILQEGFANIQRHSGSPTAEVRLASDGTESVLEIRDYGKGIAATLCEPLDDIADLGIGIRGMWERARQLGGRVEIAPAHPGTLVRALIPVVAGEVERVDEEEGG